MAHPPYCQETVQFGTSLNARYPERKVVLYSGVLGIREGEMISLDRLISKSDGIGALLSKIGEFRQIDRANPAPFPLENDAFIEPKDC